MDKVGREVKERKKERQKRGNKEPGKTGEKSVDRRRNPVAKGGRGKYHIYTEYNKMDKRKTTGKGYRAV